MYALSVAIPCSSIYPSLFYSCTALVSFSLPPLPSFPFSLTSEGLSMHQTCLSCIIIKPKYLSKHSPLHTSFGHVLIVIFPFKSPLHLLLLCCLFICPLSFFSLSLVPLILCLSPLLPARENALSVASPLIASYLVIKAIISIVSQIPRCIVPPHGLSLILCFS